MVNNQVVVDTNIVIDYLKNIENIYKKLDSFKIIYLPSVVSGELIFGTINSNNPERELEKCRKFIERSQLLNIDEYVAEKYAEIRLELKKKGKPIPENDIWIAAVCIANEIPLITNDAHFQNIDKLKTIIPTE